MFSVCNSSYRVSTGDVKTRDYDLSVNAPRLDISEYFYEECGEIL